MIVDRKARTVILGSENVSRETLAAEKIVYLANKKKARPKPG